MEPNRIFKYRIDDKETIIKNIPNKSMDEPIIYKTTIRDKTTILKNVPNQSLNEKYRVYQPDKMLWNMPEYNDFIKKNPQFLQLAKPRKLDS